VYYWSCASEYYLKSYLISQVISVEVVYFVNPLYCVTKRVGCVSGECNVWVWETVLSPSSFICWETKTQYSAKLKTWTLNKTHQAQTGSYGGLWENRKHTHTHTWNIQMYKIWHTYHCIKWDLFLDYNAETVMLHHYLDSYPTVVSFCYQLMMNRDQKFTFSALRSVQLFLLSWWLWWLVTYLHYVSKKFPP